MWLSTNTQSNIEKHFITNDIFYSKIIHNKKLKRKNSPTKQWPTSVMTQSIDQSSGVGPIELKRNNIGISLAEYNIIRSRARCFG